MALSLFCCGLLSREDSIFWRLGSTGDTGDNREVAKHENLVRRNYLRIIMSVHAISFPTGSIIFMTNYSICNDAEITEIPSQAPWHTGGTHGS